jgi:UDP-N-acetyl-D-glucosamine dehydrogenase
MREEHDMIDHRIRLLEKIRTGEARVAVIGLGYVGLPLAVGFARAGFRTKHHLPRDHR